MLARSCALILAVIVTGSLSAPWNMTVSQLVQAARGEDAVLPCSFTHPKQQDYKGYITVKWLARVADAEPFFRCSITNETGEGLSDCLEPGLRYSLNGNPQQGVLSLLIRGLQLTDNGTYYCRVELERHRDHTQSATQLYVTAEAEILSLSEEEVADAPHRTLRCEAEGHPLPNITWLSASRGLLEPRDPSVGPGPYRLSSSIPFQEDDVFTCRVENGLGGAERRYPAVNTLSVALSVCGGLMLLLLLLLLAGLAVCCRRNTARAEATPVYDNVDAGFFPQHCPDAPVGGAEEPQLVYSDISLDSLTRSGVRDMPADQGDTGVYSLLHAPH
ncbi:sialic acid binding Ig-like lectin 15, like [Myripristis murdjan]|uniref:sialic acid binding Ig-like lectin 15, like n=1 Tax=Myripristis murdjan TaxID=586833 RepID=UPI001176229D|nr:sialic acid-binding Ig-like lectin 15 [Myripristis murdjan]